MDWNRAVELTAQEHEALNELLQLENKKSLIEREYYFYTGQSMLFSYRGMLARLKRALEDSDRDKAVDQVLELLMDQRLDDLEEELESESTDYISALEDVTHQEENISNMNLSKEIRQQVDRYVTAVDRRWILFAESLYTAGMRDMLALIEGQKKYRGKGPEGPFLLT